MGVKLSLEEEEEEEEAGEMCWGVYKEIVG